MACVLASLLVPGLASASIDVGLETRVGGFELGNPAGVGAERGVTRSTQQGYAPAYDDLASGSLLAARGGQRLLGTTRDRLVRAAQDPRVRDAVENLFRSNATVGNGSSMDAFRFEQATGQLLSPAGHGQKLLDRRGQLQNLLHDSSLTPADRGIVKDLLIDIQAALGGH